MSHKFQPREVRVIGSNGEQKGVLLLREAFREADNVGLDLVCVAPKSNPPVCKIIDHGKFKYDKKKTENENKKKQKVVQTKNIKFRPKIGEHDRQVKLDRIKKFLAEGNRVKLIMTFRGRENIHKNVGAEIIYGVVDEVKNLCKPEGKLELEGRALVVTLIPLRKDK
jgi:translation initiation factor IF-3